MVFFFKFRKCTKMFGGFLCNEALVTDIFCYRYLKINNSTKKQHFNKIC